MTTQLSAFHSPPQYGASEFVRSQLDNEVGGSEGVTPRRRRQPRITAGACRSFVERGCGLTQFGPNRTVVTKL